MLAPGNPAWESIRLSQSQTYLISCSSFCNVWQTSFFLTRFTSHLTGDKSMHSEQLPDGEEAAWQWCSLPSAAGQQGWSLCHTVPHLIPLRATGYPRHKKREWQSTLFSGCDAKTKVIFHINAHDIFLNTERGFSCYKNYPSLLSQMSLYFLSQVFHCWFFSSFALIFCSVEQVQSMLLAEKTLKNPSCPLPD